MTERSWTQMRRGEAKADLMSLWASYGADLLFALADFAAHLAEVSEEEANRPDLAQRSRKFLMEDRQDWLSIEVSVRTFAERVDPRNTD